MEIPPVDIERNQAFMKVAQENFASSRVVGRSKMAVAGLLAQIIAFSVALLVPQTQQIFGLPPEYLLPPIVMYALVSISASIAMHQFGPLSKVHIRLELLESVVIHIVAGLMIYLAPDVVTPYWIFFIMLVVTGAPLYPLTRFSFGLTVSTVVFVGAAYGLEGAYEDALVALFLGSTVIYLGWRALNEQNRFLGSQAQKHVLEERLKVAQLDAERERISRELHDGVGSELTALLWSVRDIVEQQSERDNLESTTRRITEELRTIIWDLRDDPSSWTSFLNRLEQVTHSLVKGTDIDATFGTDGEPPQTPLSVDAAHELLRITQELVHNSVRHASPVNLTVTVGFETAGLELEVRDDGRGFVPTEVTERGLTNLRRRAELLDAGFEIVSSPEGTTATTTCPIDSLVAPAASHEHGIVTQ